MNKYTQNLIQKINAKLEHTPYIYFSRDPERAIGLEDLLQNFHIISIEDGYISDQLVKKGVDIFSLNKEGVILERNSSMNLIENELVQNKIKEITKGNAFYAQLFQFSPPLYKKLKELKAEIINNDASLNRFFETKLSQYRILKEKNINVPKGDIIDSGKSNYLGLAKAFGETFVIQLDRAHTGAGTFFIRSEEDWLVFAQNYGGSIVKVNEFIKGEPYTINGCVTEKGVFVSGLQYQITGYPELTSGEGSTVGNDWSFAGQLPSPVFQSVKKIIENIGKIMHSKGYKGLFGVDLILRNNDWFVIEINARQTANISMQTRLELNADITPLALLHIAEFMGIEIEEELPEKLLPLYGSQVFLRAKKDMQVQTEIKPGIYRLQSDNSAKLAPPENVIYLDEDKDKPIIWQYEGYNIEQIQFGGFVLLTQKKGSLKNKFEELARMQFKTQVINQGKLIPWILEAMKAIEELIS